MAATHVIKMEFDSPLSLVKILAAFVMLLVITGCAGTQSPDQGYLKYVRTYTHVSNQMQDKELIRTGHETCNNLSDYGEFYTVEKLEDHFTTKEAGQIVFAAKYYYCRDLMNNTPSEGTPSEDQG